MPRFPQPPFLPSPRHIPARALALRAQLVLLALASLTATSWLAPAGAHADACPGAGAGSGACPYAAVQQIGRRAEGVLRFPEAVAIGPGGDVFVADQLSYTVQEFSPSGVLENEWGSFGGGHGQFGPIGGLAVDAAGNVYVVDSSHDRIEKFSPAGAFLSAWGHRGSEVGQFNFGSSQDFTKPPGGGIAVDGSFVFVADSGNNRIERFNLSGGEPLAWGTKGSAPGQFSYPRGVAANESEVLVSDDDNHRIERFGLEGAFQAEAGTHGTGPGQFGFPYGVALDAAGNAYVADDINHRVVKLDPQLGFAGAWGGFGTKPGQLAFPRALASDPAGNNYVANTANDRIEVFGPGGEYERTLGISARGPAELTLPRGVAVDPTGRLLVADTDSNRIELFAPGSDVWSGQWTLAPGRFPGFNAPTGVAVDPVGSVLVGDRGNARVARLWGDGTPLAEIGGPGGLGGAELSGNIAVAVSGTDQESFVADAGHNRILVYGPEGTLRGRWGAGGGSGAAGTGQGEFDHPQGVAVDAAGDVYVADTGNDRVVKLDPAGSVLAEWGTRGGSDGRFRSPTGIGLDAAGNVYVLDSENNRVEVFGENGRFLARWGTRGTGPGQLSQPTGLTVGCEGDVYVADTNNNRIERFEPAARAGSGCVAPGAWPPPLDVAPVLSARLLRSRGVLARRGLAMGISCRRGCKILVTATLTPSRRSRRAVKLVALARTLPAARTGHVRLRVSAAALRRLRRELGSSHRMRARVTILAEGPTGRRTTLLRSYLVTR
jgi:tripartite motif-containing protein 71